MAASGFTPISLYYSTTASAVPTSGNLANGELGLNIADMKLYAKNSAGTVTLLASSGGAAGTVSSVAVSGGTTGLTTSGGPITTSGTITLAGTLATTNGGTGLTSFTSGGVVYASSTSALATGSVLSFDGTNLGLGTTAPASETANERILQVNAPTTFSTLSLSTSRANVSGESIGKISFDVLNNTATYRSRAQITAQSTGATANKYGADMLFFTAGDNETDATERMRLTSTGLGIGTSSVTQKLTLNGNMLVTGGAYAIGLSGNFYAGIVGDASGDYLYYKSYQNHIWKTTTDAGANSTGTERARINANGAWSYGSSGTAFGTAGEVLTSGGSGAAPTWAAAGGGGSQAFVAFGSTGGF